MAHPTNTHYGKVPLTKLIPGHNRKAGAAKHVRVMTNRKSRRLTKAERRHWDAYEWIHVT